MTEIVNGNKTDDNEIDQWIDRRPKFGNPFKISDFNDNMPDEAARELVVDLYSNYFDKRIRFDEDFRKAVQRLKGKTLACHCKPKLCHGDVIVRYLDEGAFFQSGRWWEGKTSNQESTELPDVVECPECETETAEQEKDDQLFICNQCGRETVRIK